MECSVELVLDDPTWPETGRIGQVSTCRRCSSTIAWLCRIYEGCAVEDHKRDGIGIVSNQSLRYLRIVRKYLTCNLH